MPGLPPMHAQPQPQAPRRWIAAWPLVSWPDTQKYGSLQILDMRITELCASSLPTASAGGQREQRQRCSHLGIGVDKERRKPFDSSRLPSRAVKDDSAMLVAPMAIDRSLATSSARTRRFARSHAPAAPREDNPSPRPVSRRAIRAISAGPRTWWWRFERLQVEPVF